MNAMLLNGIMARIWRIRSSKKSENLVFQIAKAHKERYAMIFENALFRLMLEHRNFEVRYAAYYNLKISYKHLGEPAREKLKDHEESLRSNDVRNKYAQETKHLLPVGK